MIESAAQAKPKEGKNPWVKGLTLLEFLTVLWIFTLQIVHFILQLGQEPSVRLLISSVCLLVIPVVLLLLLKATRKVHLWILLASEAVLIGIATITGTVAGFQLLILCTIAKAGLELELKQWLIYAAVVVGGYFLLSNLNNDLILHSPDAFKENTGLLGVLVGRDLPSLILGAGLIAVLVWAGRKERGHRLEMERLSSKLESLSTQMERNRILSDITGELDHHLDAVETRVQLALSSGQAETSTISDAREHAGEALSSIRRALKLLRDD